MEKDPAIFEEINYYVTCHLIFPTISYMYVVKRVILLTRNKKSCFPSRSSETSFGDSRGVSGLFSLP